MPQKSTLRHIIFKLQKIKAKEKILKNARGKKYLIYRAKIKITADNLRNHARRENEVKYLKC